MEEYCKSPLAERTSGSIQYTHVTGDMHRKASGIVGEFMSDFVVKG